MTYSIVNSGWEFLIPAYTDTNTIGTPDTEQHAVDDMMRYCRGGSQGDKQEPVLSSYVDLINNTIVSVI